jgi:hypothetical protein
MREALKAALPQALQEALVPHLHTLPVPEELLQQAAAAAAGAARAEAGSEASLAAHRAALEAAAAGGDGSLLALLQAGASTGAAGLAGGLSTHAAEADANHAALQAVVAEVASIPASASLEREADSGSTTERLLRAAAVGHHVALTRLLAAAVPGAAHGETAAAAGIRQVLTRAAAVSYSASRAVLLAAGLAIETAGAGDGSSKASSATRHWVR